MSHMTLASVHFVLTPLIWLVLAFILIRMFSRRRTVVVASGGTVVSTGSSVLSLPLVIAIIAFTTYLASVTASGAHATHWMTGMFASIKGSGKSMTQTRALEGFKELRLEGPIEVQFTPADKAQAVVEGDDNIVPLIKTTVSDGVLHIELDSKDSSLSPALPMRVIVTGPAVESAVAEDAGTLSLKDLHAGSLTLKAVGAATVNAAGTANDLHVASDEAGNCDASKMTAVNARVKCDGAAKATLAVTGSLEVKADAAAVVTVTGSADTVNVEASGASYVHLKELLAKTVKVALDGAAYCHVTASGVVSGKVEGGSTLKVRGKTADVQVKPEEGSSVSHE